MHSDQNSKSLNIFAPAKVNLFLHLINKRSDGYHNLQSLVTFADIGDTITLTPAQEVSFEISGAFSNAFSDKELDSSPQSKNIMMKALWRLSRLYDHPPLFQVKLEKNLPLASGIGGGSTDAAALIWGLTKIWGALENKDAFDQFMIDLGADVPVCFKGTDSLIEGIGDDISYIDSVPEMPIVLINPLKSCSTQSIFKSYQNGFREPVKIEKMAFSKNSFIDFLKQQENVLESTAIEYVPDISNILNALRYAEGCSLARMSGSGATCFGLFEDEASSHKAAKQIYFENPDWWVKTGKIGQSARY